MPTNNALVTKGVVIDMCCSRCNFGDVEDIFHTLWRCPVIFKILKLTGLKKNILLILGMWAMFAL